MARPMREFEKDEDRREAVRRWVDQTDGGAWTPAALQEIADGPIIDPLRIYLPAGRLTKAQAEARDRDAIRRLR